MVSSARRRPAYLETHESGLLARKVSEALETLAPCTVCPRDCRVDRLADETKACRVGRRARVASFFAHLGEEDCLRGHAGSGTLFFSGCALMCVFCQNWETSSLGEGEAVSPERLAAMMLSLQHRGCHNINFVTPEHVVPQILEALPYAIEGGLRVPLVYNTSGYDSLHSLRLMEGVVDIYMPDLKCWDPRTSRRYLRARDYPERTRDAIREMHRQVGDLVMDDEGIALRGLLVRHLVMPGGLADTAEILRWLATEISQGTYVNVMDQYHPDGLVLREPERYESLARVLTAGEHDQALRLAREAGLTRLDERNPLRRARRLAW